MSGIREEIQDLERFIGIVETVANYGFNSLIRKAGLDRLIPFHHRVRGEELNGPEEFRRMIEELGTVFIKFGQVLAERKDLIPEKYAEALKDLENNVEPFEGEKAREMLDEEVGLENFREFDEEPVASASIAQVHEAELNNGDRVAVKIRRPGIKEQIEKDLDILMFLARKADKHKNLGHSQLQRDVEQFAEWTRQEIDFNNEIENGRILGEEMESWEKVRIPEMYPKYSSEAVTVMEYVDAVRCDDVEALEELDIEFSDIARIGVQAQLEQIFKYGFFHADPHPSNFLVDQKGNLVFLDFGIMGRLTRKKRRHVLLMLYSMITGDVDGVLDAIKTLGYCENDADIEELRTSVEKTLKNLQGKTLGQMSFTHSFADLTLEASRHGIYMPNDLIVMGKGMATMEGIGLDIYPDYNFTEENREFIEKLIKEQLEPKQSTKDMMADALRNKELFTKLPSKINEAISSDSKHVNVHVENQQNSEAVTAALILASAFFASKYVEPSEAAALAAVVAAAAYFLG
ncbi:MAG: ABC1 kinase family protein [Candidatus Nanohaloarchaea archaeon]